MFLCRLVCFCGGAGLRENVEGSWLELAIAGACDDFGSTVGTAEESLPRGEAQCSWRAFGVKNSEIKYLRKAGVKLREVEFAGIGGITGCFA